MAVHYLGDNGTDGMSMGTSSTEKISFYAATPVAQQTVTAVTTTVVAAAVISIQSALVDLGLIVTA